MLMSMLVYIIIYIVNILFLFLVAAFNDYDLGKVTVNVC